MGPRVGLDAVEKRKILQCRESNPGHPACSPSLYRLSYPDSLKNFIYESLNMIGLIRYVMYSTSTFDSLRGLVIRVPDYRSGSPGIDSRRYQIF
jgi:hypothetical protein